MTETIPEVGDTAPDFTLPTQTEGAEITLSDYRGEKNVVLYFYPKDNTPGCTMESKDFSDAYTDFTKADTVIVGLSKDSIKSHDKFVCKLQLPFDLASDAESDVCERYGVWTEKNMYGKKYMGIQRATFLIDKQGVVQAAWPKVKVKGHVEEVLEKAQALA